MSWFFFLLAPFLGASPTTSASKNRLVVPLGSALTPQIRRATFKKCLQNQTESQSETTLNEPDVFQKSEELGRAGQTKRVFGRKRSPFIRIYLILLSQFTVRLATRLARCTGVRCAALARRGATFESRSHVEATGTYSVDHTY